MKTKRTNKLINVVTLGCSKNTVDSEVLLRQLEANKLRIVHNSEEAADVVIINTCGFIKDAKEESVNTILQFAQAKERGDIEDLYVMGCLSERYKKKLEHEIQEVDKYFGTNDLQDIVETIAPNFKNELTGERYLTTPAHYAYLKISEGCDRHCSFCAIPLMRGKHRSTPIEDLVRETEFLADQGVKELILIAQDLTYYGIDLYGRQKLAELLKKLAEVPGIEWIRLHYAYPRNFPLDVLRVMKEEDKICNYLDIPFQHISDRVLKMMRRGVSGSQTRSLIREFRKEIPELALRTTLLTGHPGEGEKEFAELMDFVREIRFERMGVFSYSEEEDTYGAKHFKDDVPEEIKQERVEQLMDLQQSISLDLNRAKIGKTFKVVIDREEGDNYIGRTVFDSPEVDNEVIVSSEQELDIGQFCMVKIKDAGEFDLFGEILH